MRQYLLYGILIYLAAINIFAFFLYGIDKWKARHDKIGGYEYGTEIKKKLLELEGNPTKTSVMRTRCERE